MNVKTLMLLFQYKLVFSTYLHHIHYYQYTASASTRRDKMTNTFVNFIDGLINSDDSVSLETIVLLYNKPEFNIVDFITNDACDAKSNLSKYEVRALLKRTNYKVPRDSYLDPDTAAWLDKIKSTSAAIENIKAFELSVLFKVFPRYSERYNIPSLFSEFSSFSTLGAFCELLHNVDKTRINMINSKLEQIFKVGYIDQVMLMLMGTEDVDYVNFKLSAVQEYVNQLVVVIKTPKTRLKTLNVDDFCKRSKTVPRSVVNTIALVLFKCCEKAGLKTNFFLRCKGLL